jgi:hypothetical protein
MAATKDVERLPGWADVDARIIPTGADAMNMVYKVDSRLGWCVYVCACVHVFVCVRMRMACVCHTCCL